MIAVHEGREMNAEGLRALSRILHALWMHLICLNLFCSSQSSDSAAMFPGRYPTVPDNMWTFWNPQDDGTSRSILWR